MVKQKKLAARQKKQRRLNSKRLNVKQIYVFKYIKYICRKKGSEERLRI